MPKIKGLTEQTGVLTTYVFWCQGCERVHPYRVAKGLTETNDRPMWTFNGDLDKPTFSPSLLVYPSNHPDGTPYQVRCHLFLIDGHIQYCSDSEHSLAGQTVPCPEWDDDRW